MICNRGTHHVMCANKIQYLYINILFFVNSNEWDEKPNLEKKKKNLTPLTCSSPMGLWAMYYEGECKPTFK